MSEGVDVCVQQSTWLYRLGRALFRLVYRLLGKYEVRGLQHFPQTGGVILAPNHISYADPPLVGCVVNRPVFFMAKEELFKIPLLGKLLPIVHAFPVRRGSADRKALKHAIDLLSQGKVVVLFPEGKRSPDGLLQTPELGISLVAQKSGAPVVPVALLGSNDLLPLHSPLPRPASLKVKIGPPLYFASQDPQVKQKVILSCFAEQVMRGIEETMQE